MVSFEDFKKALGPEADNLSNEEIVVIKDKMDHLADALFDTWIAQENKQLKT